MSEDKNIESSDTSTGDAADKWIRANAKEVIDPKERVKQLYSLGDQVADIAQKIAWKNRDYKDEVRRNSPTVNVVTVTDKDGKVELITLDLKVPEIGQLAGITSQDPELQIDGREIDFIQFYNKGFYFLDWAKQYFGDRPTLGISFGDERGYHYEYAFTDEGECVKRSLLVKGEDRVRDERTQDLTPDEINKVDVGMRMLKSNLEEFPLQVPKI